MTGEPSLSLHFGPVVDTLVDTLGVREPKWGQSVVDTASRLIERRREDSSGQGTDDSDRDVHGTHGFAHTDVDHAIANVRAGVVKHVKAGLSSFGG